MHVQITVLVIDLCGDSHPKFLRPSNFLLPHPSDHAHCKQVVFAYIYIYIYDGYSYMFVQVLHCPQILQPCWKKAKYMTCKLFGYVCLVKKTNKVR